MQAADFTKDKWGKLVKNTQGCHSFVPHPLPPPIELSWTLVRLMSEAERALSELAGAARRLPDPNLLIRPLLRKEAVLSSKIEGTQASLSDLLHFEASNERIESTSDVLEVANYVKALEYGLKQLKHSSINLHLLRTLHAVLMSGVRGEGKSPGRFRTTQNWIGRKHCPIERANYVPPPVIQMHDCLQDFERYLRSKSELPTVIQLAVLHYQFEAIHPFIDGNGRLGRLLITLLLSERDLLPYPVLYLSRYFEENRDEYYDHLLKVSQRGAWMDWVTFVLEGIASQAVDGLDRVRKLDDLREKYYVKVKDRRASASVISLIDVLFSSPAITVGQACKHLGVTPKAAQDIINKLISMKIVKETTGRPRNRIFAAQEIIRIIEE